MLTLVLLAALAADPAPFGTVERLDPRFDTLIAPGTRMEKLAGGFKWTEGPLWMGDDLLFSDIPNNAIMKWQAGKGVVEFKKPAGYTGENPFPGKEPGSNGLGRDAQGRLLICMHGDRCVARVESDDKVVKLAERYMGKRLNSPNDLTVCKNGDILFTDPPYGLPKGDKDPARELTFQGVYRLTLKGDLTLLTKEMTRPNGIALSPDEKTLYVANSDPEKANWMSYPVNADGTLGAGKQFFDATPWAKAKKPGLPDGLKVDAAGNLWATGPGGVHVFTAKGEHLGTLATGVPTSNCGWGDDGSTLYITANTDIVRIKTRAKGLGF